MVRTIPLAEDNLNKLSKDDILADYRLGWVSREMSLLARREVLTGKAKFGISGAGKELPQIVMARFFQKGDFRSGYYRDQTLMMALDLLTPASFFAQLYADVDNDPHSAGRQMTAHFATPLIDEQGHWLNHTEHYNTSADLSPTAGQMARGLGLALASKVFRELPDYNSERFSVDGNEVCFCTIGDASTSEGVFWESLNAAGVQQVPMFVSVWDDGYGISVPREFQTTKDSISAILEGFEYEEGKGGILIRKVKAWDYAALLSAYQQLTHVCRREHIPVVLHVEEVTQPQGHSTSGSHERYKSPERLQWEKDMDCMVQFGSWIIEQGLADESQLDAIRKAAKSEVRAARNTAWETFNAPALAARQQLSQLYAQLPAELPAPAATVRDELGKLLDPVVSEILANGRTMRTYLAAYQLDTQALDAWIVTLQQNGAQQYHTHLWASGSQAAVNVPAKAAVYTDDSPQVNGYQILNQFFEQAFNKHPELVAFGEDVGQIGDVNQGFAGLQEKFGIERIWDTGIREWTIIGQAIGLAMRGIRPIAEIQYLDYLLYGLEPLSDDLCTLRWRTAGQQMAPAIIRTRGHRLEGIWHAGSPLGMIIHSLRGMHVCVPRNMTQAAGMYATLLQSCDPALVIECLNGYRRKETLPDNLDSFSVPLGVPETLHDGDAVTLVTYGSLVRQAQEACERLADVNVLVDLIDIQTLLPFDLEHRIVQYSLSRTNRLLIVDEDVPGGASAYILQQVMEVQQGYRHLDAAPMTLTAKAHRPPYGSDGDYFSKPSTEDIVDAVLRLIAE